MLKKAEVFVNKNYLSFSFISETSCRRNTIPKYILKKSNVYYQSIKFCKKTREKKFRLTNKHLIKNTSNNDTSYPLLTIWS